MRRRDLVGSSVELVLAFLLIPLLTRARTPISEHTRRVVCRVPTSEKIVALTFDDGPHPIYTPAILCLLNRYHVKATVFMVGSRMERYPDLVRRVAAEGHAIGNHTYTHRPHFERSGAPHILDELDWTDRVIQDLTGRRTVLFRPPRGRMGAAEIHAAEEEGYRIVLWTVCADHHDAPTPAAMAQRVVRGICPGGIILAHDGGSAGRWKDVLATPLIIRALQHEGYRFVTVPELLRCTARRRVVEYLAPRTMPRAFARAEGAECFHSLPQRWFSRRPSSADRPQFPQHRHA